MASPATMSDKVRGDIPARRGGPLPGDDPYALDTQTQTMLEEVYRFYDIPGIREKSLSGPITPAENALAVVVGNLEVMLTERRNTLIWRWWRRWAYRLRAWGRGDIYIRLYPNPGIGVILTRTRRLSLSALGGFRVMKRIGA